ncbi:MAG: HTTM domain-containing protein [Planctomycetes bacterium]|uniref:HTTM domain-containing protein n=1 Tax=uncultured Gimesia sp. TaxID=1678688 RepID=UPI00261C49C5|nr:HTTM domain-containing protein [uncultured Gimesia sp.]MCH9656601.1 HTTM domain-containing protein [Planctomycetota bacterium]MCH9727643.1 HTTM domain-containing protein [Planctomycetota bacterium]MCH9779126.1 HTTM domain-containing protein [Planctomycetota bacterium]
MNDKTTITSAPEAQALALAVFRICYGMVLLIEVCHLFYFRHLILDPVPYLQPAPTLLSILLLAWLATILCVIAGIKTTLSCILNYGFTVVFLGTLLYPLFEYHVDYVYTGVNFLLMLIPVSDRLSLDSYLRSKKQTETQPARNYSVFINTLLFVGITLVYADSVFFKGTSPMWCGGLGVWLPASLPQNSWLPVPQFLLDQKWLMLSLGYLTLVFETVFPILMWWRRARLPLFVIGVGLHFSIGLVFPIPFFGLTYLSLYLLLLPVSFWQSVDRRIQRFSHEIKTVVESGEQTIFPERSHLGTREKLTIATLCLVTTLQVCIIIGRFPVFSNQIKPNVLRQVRVFLGATDHGVFMDSHFRNFNRLYAIVYKKPDGSSFFLPVRKNDGRPGAYLTGRFWVWWNWRVSGPRLTGMGFRNGLQKTSSFWAYKNNVSLDHADFEILSRPVQTPTVWGAGHLTKQKQQKWSVVGHATWRDHKFNISTKK